MDWTEEAESLHSYTQPSHTLHLTLRLHIPSPHPHSPCGQEEQHWGERLCCESQSPRPTCEQSCAVLLQPSQGVVGAWHRHRGSQAGRDKWSLLAMRRPTAMREQKEEAIRHTPEIPFPSLCQRQNARVTEPPTSLGVKFPH